MSTIITHMKNIRKSITEGDKVTAFSFLEELEKEIDSLVDTPDDTEKLLNKYYEYCSEY